MIEHIRGLGYGPFEQLLFPFDTVIETLAGLPLPA